MNTKTKWKVFGWLMALGILTVCVGLGYDAFTSRRSSSGNPSDPNGIRRIASKNLDYGILTATVGGTAMDIDPNAYITVELIDSGVAWEIIVNGIVVNRFRADGTEDKSVKPGRVGTRDTVVYRVIEGQAAGTMRLAYVKHRDEKPPLGWFGAAKKLL